MVARSVFVYAPYVERTLRMMEFFIRTLERFGDDEAQSLVRAFTAFAKLLQDYLAHTDS